RYPGAADRGAAGRDRPGLRHRHPADRRRGEHDHRQRGHADRPRGAVPRDRRRFRQQPAGRRRPVREQQRQLEPGDAPGQAGTLAGTDTIGNVTVNVLGSGRLDLGSALTQSNEVSLLAFDPSTTGGNFTIKVAGAAVGPIAFSTTAATTAANITTVLNTVLGF